jgi:methane monooxygenase PmoA-like
MTNMKQLLCLLTLGVSLCAQVKLTQHDSDHITVAIGGQPFTDFYFGPSTNKPYLWPLRAATGTIVTRGYPIDATVAGETHDHPHHRGLWFTHGDVNGYDFWGNEPSQESPKKGKVVLKKIVKVASGAKSGLIEAVFDWDAAGKPILEETRGMTFYNDPHMRIMDFDLALKAIEKAKFGDTKEGTFAIRLAPGLEEQERRSPATPKRTGLMVNAQGKQGEKQVWGKPSEWVDYFGELAGEKIGIAIFDHPKNPRHPTYWHSRSYGLFAANIFGEHDFFNDKSRDGSMTLEPGQSLRFRYRVIIHPGDYKSADIARLYADYTAGK